MPKLSGEALQVYRDQKRDKQQFLAELMSTPFDLEKPEHLKALKRYIDEYELQLHQMYFYQALGELVNCWAGFWALSFVLPVPDFITDLLAYGLYAGVGGWVLKSFNYSNFMEQTSEMQQLYNWALKGNNHKYDDSIDNEAKLENPEIQRLIRVLAPMSSPEFLLAWKPIVGKQPENNSWVSSVYNAGSYVTSTTYNAFTYFSQQPTIDPSMAIKIQQLKSAVESGEFRKGSFEGFKQAIEYFATSTEFRNLMKEKGLNLVQEPIAMLKEKAPSKVSAFAASL